MLLAAALAAIVWANRRPLLLRERLAHPALDPDRRLGNLPGPSAVGEQRPDDLLLLRHRARGAARVRRRRAARAPPADPAGARRARRDDRPDRDLPRLQRGQGLGAGLGGGDVDGHRLRARHAGPGRAALPRSPARLPADDHRRRRRRRAAGDRRRLQRRDRARAAVDRGRGLLPGPGRPRAQDPAEPRLPAARAGLMGGAVRIGCRPRRPRARRRPRHRGLPGGPRRAGAGDEPLPQLPRAADPGARPLGPGRAGRRRLGECAPA